MNLADVKGAGPRRRRARRIGRGVGSGWGKTSGRGQKGQRARSGWSGWGGKVGHEGGQMPLYRRLPKRGFTNTPFRVRYEVVNVGDLQRFADGTEVDLVAVQEAGIVARCGVRLKVLGAGTLERKLTVKAERFSATAKEKIEAAGGRAVEVS
ncbi:MAG: 50S ribosomal protein L15 [Planctomycetota bacterium]